MGKPQSDLTAETVKKAIRSQYLSDPDKCKPKQIMKSPFMLYAFNGYNTHPSVCGVDFLDTKDGKIVVILTDLGQGTSVTNAAEQLVYELYRKFLFKSHPEDIIWVEHYPENENEYAKIEFAHISFDGRAIGVSWKPIELRDLNLK